MTEEIKDREDPSQSSDSNSSKVDEALEHRVKRLEDAVASLQDTRVLEERIIERLSRSPSLQSSNKEKVIDRKYLSGAESSKPKSDSEKSAFPQESLKQAWFFIDVWKEFSTICKMFFDVRYHMGWFTRILTIILVPAFLLSNYWPRPPIPIVAEIWERVFFLLVAFFFFKALSREAQRYKHFRELRNQLKDYD